MSFWPNGFDFRAPVVALLDLCEVDTVDGPARFIIGADGAFRDVDGHDWCGSQLLSVSSLQAAIDGEAPSGSLTVSYFQDPDAPDLVQQVKAGGIDQIDGRQITFLVQPILSMSEFRQPSVPPVQWLQRTMRALTFAASGAQDRSITLSFEAWSEQRRGSRRLRMNTDGHATLIGEANPSLSLMPTSDFEEEKLFG